MTGKFSRRRTLYLGTSIVALPALARVARAQPYPVRPVRIIVPVAPGGSTDIVARLLSQFLSERLGHPFVVENRPGAGGNVGTETVVKAPADGYTLLLINVANATNSAFYKKLPFNFRRDIAPVAGFDRQPYAMLVQPSFLAKSIPEFVEYAKAHPGKINMASTGNGTGGHLAGELFQMKTGITMVHVPYRGSAPAITDLIGGQVNVYFGSLGTSVEHITSGRLRALAVTSTERSSAIQDIPTMGEFLPGCEASFWTGVGAPRETPREIVTKLNDEINLVLADSSMKSRLSELGSAPLAMSPADFGKLFDEETEKWGKVIKFAGITPD
ncbi:MAG: Bug family tripartite tricarboxylate transporter substrate binding protein [Candidatus Sulfotelmatobacter sp.]